MLLIDKKLSVDKPLTLRSIAKYENVLLQFTTARLIYKLRQRLLHGCYNSRQLLLQFSTGITIHDIISIHDRTWDRCLTHRTSSK